MNVVIPDDLVESGGGKIVLLVMDGLGGLPDPRTGKTELETADTPNLDALAGNAALGLLRPLLPGVTVGSGPGHLALFGYDPLRWNIGRGVLSALGVGFPLEHGDLAVRLNLASKDDQGRVTDRRAGRPSDAENRRLVQKLRDGVRAPEGVKVFFEPEKEHRLVLILRGPGLSAELSDTDPQETGVPPLPVTPTSPEAQQSARLVQQVLDDGMRVLADEPVANALLARGFAEYTPYPSFRERYRLRALSVARYPMYNGVASLVGMDVHSRPDTDEGVVAALEAKWNDYDFFFLHFKAVDSRGEDGDFAAKAAAIAAVDRLVPRVTALGPDVFIVTGDHSTPSRYRAHSWHPVPVLLASQWARGTGQPNFGEATCARGELGILESKHLMTLALAHAGRLAKFGA